MPELLLVALAGFMASLVDGALGMGFGPTSSSILLSSGLSPSAASTVVNIAKVATGVVAAISHWRFRNIDHRLVLKLAIPGSIGAIVGVVVLTRVDPAMLKPILAAMLVLIGLRILLRFSKPLPTRTLDLDADVPHDPDKMPAYDERGVEVAGFAGGVTNGLVGAWGPVVTPFLLHRSLPPRFAIGSVNTAEVAVAVVSVGSLISAVGRGGIDLAIVAAMLLGGVIAAPIAAWFVKLVPARGMGLAVAGLLLLTNAQQLLDWADVGQVRWAVYVAIPTVVVLIGVLGRRVPEPAAQPA